MPIAGNRVFYFRIIGFMLLLVIGFTSLLLSIMTQYSSFYNGPTNSLFRERDPQSLTNRAKELHLFEADLSGAQHCLQRALVSNSLYIPAWLSLAVVYNDLGEKEKALNVLAYIVKLTENLKRYRWDTTLVAYQLGQLDILPAELSFIIDKIPGKSRTSALELAFSTWKNPENIMNNIGRANLEPAFAFAIQKRLSEHALFFWHVLEVEGKKLDQRLLSSFTEMLLRNKQITDAVYVWKRKFERYEKDDLIYNSDFKGPFWGSGFDWRMSKSMDFDVVIENNKSNVSTNKLHYRFKGWENLSFYHLQQIVPVIGGKKYQFIVEMRSQKLTTDQRPYFEVYGYNCGMKRAFTEMVTANGDWKEYACEVGVPEECQAVTVRLRREESGRIDSKLSGQLWIRKPHLRDIGENYLILDEAL